MTYRLSRQDEDDVRWALADDQRGDNGAHSLQSNFEDRSIYKPILNCQELKCGPILVTKKRIAKGAIMHGQDETMLRTSKRERVVFGTLDAIGPKHHETLVTAYGYSGSAGVLEAFDDLAALAMMTDGALDCQRRERSHTGTELSVFESLLALSSRIKSKGDKSSPSDQSIWQEIYSAADGRLSRACREYTRCAAKARQLELLGGT